jgi:ABC-type glycerol-3-phosphate transport system substrate-binding protein
LELAVTLRRQRWGLAGGAALAALILTGCSGSGSGFSDNGGSGSTTSTTLRLLVNITPVLTKQFYTDLVAPYQQAHPGIKITIEVPSANDVSTTLQQEMAAGSAPDIASGNVGNAAVPQLLALPNEDWVTSAPYSTQSAIGGKVWQVGSGGQVQSLVFYNKTAFTKAGIAAPPKTFDEMTQDLVKLKSAGYVGMQTAGDWVTGAQVQMMSNVNVLGTTKDWFVQRNKGATSFKDSNWAKVLDVYQSWIDQKLTPPNAMGLKYQDSIDQFLAGKSGMYIMGNWFVPTADQTKKPFDVGVFPMPTFDGAPAPVAGSPSIPYSILQSSKSQAAAVDLVKYLVTDKAAVLAELKAEGNFRKGFEYPGTPLNDAVAAIVSSAPDTVVASDGQGDNAAPSGFGDQVNKLVQGMYVKQKASSVVSSLDQWYTSNAK